MLKYSPSLTDKIAIKSSRGMDYVVKQIDSIINPKGSTLIIARDLLIKYGYEPPVITDDWWLDVIEYCGNEFPHHEYLWFSIPWKSWAPEDRGRYIGLSALQMVWQQEADANRITQLSHPTDVLRFIESQPGLKDACLKDPKKAEFYFPQLTIKTFGGFLESSFDELEKAGHIFITRQKFKETMALGHTISGYYSFIGMADNYFAGAGEGIGPSTRRYDLIDCLVWLMSAKSSWLPSDIRTGLFKGLTEWGVWEWRAGQDSICNFEGNAVTGALSEALYKTFSTIENKTIKLTKKIERDIKTRIEYSKSILLLPESVENLVQIFLDKKVIDSWINSKIEMQRRRENGRGKTSAKNPKNVA